MSRFKREEIALSEDLKSNYARKIPSLTGIRGIAACWVVLVHFGTSLASVSNIDWLGTIPVLSRGYMGVDLFFVLSGFVLTLNYASMDKKGSQRDGKTFLVGRVFRLFPLNFSVLLLLLLLVQLDPKAYWGPGPFTIKSFIAAIMLTQGWFNIASAWNYPAWSLSAEWFAYLLFAMLYRRLRAPLAWKSGLLQAVFCLVPFFTVLIAIRSTSVDHAERLGLVRCICEFFGGAMLCRSWRGCWCSPQFANKVFLGGCSCLMIGIAIPVLEPIIVIGFAALVFSCACNSPLCQTAFARPFVLFLGDVSYSIYLTHAVILGTGLVIARSDPVRAYGMPSQFAVLIAALLLVIPVSYVAWRFIEIPGQALGRIWMRRPRSGFAVSQSS